jgi:hypothetical protein
MRVGSAPGQVTTLTDIAAVGVRRVRIFAYRPAVARAAQSFEDPNDVTCAVVVSTMTRSAGGRTMSTTSKTVLQYGMNEPPDFWVIAELIDGISADITWTSPI